MNNVAKGLVGGIWGFLFDNRARLLNNFLWNSNRKMRFYNDKKYTLERVFG